jgi:hypothetical protein
MSWAGRGNYRWSGSLEGFRAGDETADLIPALHSQVLGDLDSGAAEGPLRRALQATALQPWVVEARDLSNGS